MVYWCYVDIFLVHLPRIFALLEMMYLPFSEELFLRQNALVYGLEILSFTY